MFYATDVLCNQYVLCYQVLMIKVMRDLLSPAGPECEGYDDEGETEQDGR